MRCIATLEKICNSFQIPADIILQPMLMHEFCKDPKTLDSINADPPTCRRFAVIDWQVPISCKRLQIIACHLPAHTTLPLLTFPMVFASRVLAFTSFAILTLTLPFLSRMPKTIVSLLHRVGRFPSFCHQNMPRQPRFGPSVHHQFLSDSSMENCATPNARSAAGYGYLILPRPFLH